MCFICKGMCLTPTPNIAFFIALAVSLFHASQIMPCLECGNWAIWLKARAADSVRESDLLVFQWSLLRSFDDRWTARYTTCSAGLTIVANVAIATGPRFWGPAVLCVKFVLYYMQEWILKFSYPGQTLRTVALYFAHAIQKLHSLKASWFCSFSLKFAFNCKI